jgi:WD40 repeat protein
MRHQLNGKNSLLVLLLALLHPQLRAQSTAPTGETGTTNLPSVAGSYDPATFEPIRAFGFGDVESAEFSPDGQRIAVSGNSVLFLLNADTYEVERQLFGHSGGVLTLKWSPDGRFLASGGADYLIKIWDAESGELVRTLEHFRRVNSLDWSPDGRQLVSAGYFMTAVWEMETGSLIAFLSNAAMTTVAWSPDGQFVAAGDALDRKVRVWEAKTWSLVRELTGFGHLNAVAFSPDSKFLATGASDPNVKIWQTQTWELVRTLEHPGGAHGLAWSRCGQFLASGGGTVKIWDSDGFLVQTLGEQPVTIVESVSWDAKGTRLVSAGPRRVYVWNLEVGDPPLTLRGHVGPVASVSWNPDGRYLATAAGDYPYRDNSVNIWEAATGRLLRTFTGDNRGMTSVAWSPDGKLLAATNGRIRIWDAETGKEVTAFGYGSHLTWSPDGKYLASDGYPAAHVWDVETGQLVRDFPGVVPAWSPDGRFIAVASPYSEGRLRVYEFETGELLWTVQHPSIRAVAWSPDGRYLASTGIDDAIWNSDLRIWDAETGTLIRSIPVTYGSALYAAAWSPDSQYVAVGAGFSSRAITIWDIQTGTLVRTLLGHTDLINSLQWSPVACHLASGAWDGAPRLWGCPLH